MHGRALTPAFVVVCLNCHSILISMPIDPTAVQALALLGWEFEDVFEKTSFDVVDQDPAQQQEW